MKHETSYLVRYASLILILAISATAAQAQTRTIELQTDEGLLTIPLQDTSALQLLSDGNIAATAETGFICQQGDSCSDVQVSLAGADGGLFSLSKSTVTQGLDFTVSWDARGAWECTGSGLDGTIWNSNNPKLASGIQSVSSSELSVGEHQVEIVCKNGPVSANGALKLTVEESTTEISGCEDVLSLDNYTGWTQTTDARSPFGTNEEQTFEEFFGPWPGGGSSVEIAILKNEYTALVFTTGNLDSGSGGQFNRDALTPTTAQIAGAGPLIVSFSRCPGDFDPNSPALDSPGCVIDAPYGFSTISWGGPGTGKKCELQSNTQYFMNIVHTNSDVGVLPPVQVDCGGKPRCGWLWNTSGGE